MNVPLNPNDPTNNDQVEETSEIDMAIKLETNLVEGDESELVVRNFNAQKQKFFGMKIFSSR